MDISRYYKVGVSWRIHIFHAYSMPTIRHLHDSRIRAGFGVHGVDWSRGEHSHLVEAGLQPTQVHVQDKGAVQQRRKSQILREQVKKQARNSGH